MMKVLMITSEWPTQEHPEWVPFIVDQVNALRQAGIVVDVFDFRGGKNPIRYCVAWISLRRQYNFRHYDLLHAHFGQAGLLAFPTNIPLITTFHGSDLQGNLNNQGRYTRSGKLLQNLSQLVAKLSSQVIVVAEHLKRFLPQNISCSVIPCGLNLEKFIPIPKALARKQLNLSENDKIVLFVANPTNPIKRYSLAEAAIKLVQNRLENVRLRVVSGVPHEQVSIFMNAGDVLLLTSRHEGSPTVVKEALACNLRVVSVNVGDVGERLEGIEGCIVCENDLPETIAQALEQVLISEKPFSGRDAIKDLDNALIAKKIISVYHKALDAKT